jgi:hypothetical protein
MPVGQLVPVLQDGDFTIGKITIGLTMRVTQIGLL